MPGANQAVSLWLPVHDSLLRWAKYRASYSILKAWNVPAGTVTASAATTFAFHRHWALRFLGKSTASDSKKPSHVWPTSSGNRRDAQNGLAVNVTFSPVLTSSRLKSRVYVRLPDVLPLASCTILSASTWMTIIEVSRFSPVRTSRFRKTAVSPTFGSGRSAGGSASAGQAVAHDAANIDSATIANRPRNMDE